MFNVQCSMFDVQTIRVYCGYPAASKTLSSCSFPNSVRECRCIWNSVSGK